MDRRVIIREGMRDFRLEGVSRIVTDNAELGEDEWVCVDEMPMQQRFINANGSYDAKEEGLFAYSKLTVNVSGGGVGSTQPTKPGPYGSTVRDDDKQQGTLPKSPAGTVPRVSPSEPQVPPSVGNAVVGIDPATGNLSVASVKRDGTVGVRPIPDSIAILTPPAKVEYEEGEEIRYDGLVVEVLKTDGTTYRDDDYPDGTIVWSPVSWLPLPSRPMRNWQLITPMERATIGSEGDDAEILPERVRYRSYDTLPAEYKPYLKKGVPVFGEMRWWIVQYDDDGNPIDCEEWDLSIQTPFRMTAVIDRQFPNLPNYYETYGVSRSATSREDAMSKKVDPAFFESNAGRPTLIVAYASDEVISPYTYHFHGNTYSMSWGSSDYTFLITGADYFPRPRDTHKITYFEEGKYFELPGDGTQYWNNYGGPYYKAVQGARASLFGGDPIDGKAKASVPVRWDNPYTSKQEEATFGITVHIHREEPDEG